MDNPRHSYPSLSEVHQTVDTTSTRRPGWRKILSFFGPAYLVSVGYMDPGNWATDLAGGSQFGYKLIWVLLMSNLMALLLQSLSARLGIVRGRDLAQANRETYPKYINFCLYVLAEIAIAACDLAEVLGMAIGIQLLTGIPLLWAVLITVLDTFLFLLLQRLGIRKMEAFIICLIGIIGISFLTEIIIAKPQIGEVVKGFIPSIPSNAALYIAVGIIGATVMPHNLYLHSALVQTRKIKRDEKGIRRAIKLNFIDSTIALNLAFFVNAAILVLAASAFYFKGRTDVAEIKLAYELLDPLLGSKWAPYLFAIALIAAGQSSTITGTLAGQIVMEGYLRLRINPWMRRLMTRLIAIIPAVIVILINGEKDINNTSVLVYLNLRMVTEQASGYFATSDNIFWKFVIILAGLLFIILLVTAFVYPLLKKKPKDISVEVHKKTVALADDINIPSYKRIAIALDFSNRDQQLIAAALGQANEFTRIIFIHIVESVSARILGNEADDYESRHDQEKLDNYVAYVKEKGITAESKLGFRNRNKEIPRLIKEVNADLLIIGAHGHSGVKDWFYGETIDAVRHQLKIPVLIVSE